MSLPNPGWSVVAFEVPTAAKWSDLGENDDALAAGTGLNDDAVTATKIDWASTGADGGIWWEELGRTTLSGTADTISVSSFPARRYIKIIVKVITSGTANMKMTFNGDNGNNYDYAISNDFGAVSSAVSQSNINLLSAASANTKTGWYEFDNISDQFKLVTGQLIQTGGVLGNAPTGRQILGKWANNSAQVTTITIANDSTGDYAAGTQLILLGHN